MSIPRTHTQFSSNHFISLYKLTSLEPVAVINEVELVDDSKPYSGEKSFLSRDSFVALADNTGSYLDEKRSLSRNSSVVNIGNSNSFLLKDETVRYPPSVPRIENKLVNGKFMDVSSILDV